MILLAITHDRATGSRCRTLIVEDDPASRQALTKILAMVGYDVSSVPTLTEGLAELAKAPDCVILDLMLPDGNGMAILERIRRDKLPIRVAIVTGADKPMLMDAQQLLPDALFTKPVDLSKLLHWLKTAA